MRGMSHCLIGDLIDCISAAHIHMSHLVVMIDYILNNVRSNYCI